ncbi:MAG: sugar phosphate nucleotidyltransferase [Firmicutes bacterium]|nr:sugar phosphate nucleotidyltransferase [Bacillota bacterium]
MKLVLLSGGSGKRLWPLSNDARSKQFLKVLPSEQGRAMSMVQRVWRQMESLGLADQSFICTSRAQVDIIESQLGDVPVIVEPERRDTFPAVALISAYLLDVVGAPDDEVVAILPVDPYVEEAYFQAIVALERALADSDAEMALLGVRPEFATSKFGYLRVGRDDGGASGVLNVAAFVEKPPIELAEQLLGEGALWNCGVFCFRLGYLRSILQGRGLPWTYSGILDAYGSLPARSFDYEVVEQAAKIVAIAYSGTWKDLGTWETLSEEMEHPFAGIGTAVDCEDTHVINELSIPVVTMGLKNAVVVASPDGVLVAEKGYTSALKDVVKPFSGRPMYEERYWGNYRVFDYSRLADGTEVLVRNVELFSGKNLSYQQHARRTEMWTVVEGSGDLILNNRMTELQPGDVVQVFAGMWHAVRAHDHLVFVEVQRGLSLDEEDIVRRFENWDEIVAHCAVLS